MVDPRMLVKDVKWVQYITFVVLEGPLNPFYRLSVKNLTHRASCGDLDLWFSTFFLLKTYIVIKTFRDTHTWFLDEQIKDCKMKIKKIIFDFNFEFNVLKMKKTNPSKIPFFNHESKHCDIEKRKHAWGYYQTKISIKEKERCVQI